MIKDSDTRTQAPLDRVTDSYKIGMLTYVGVVSVFAHAQSVIQELRAEVVPKKSPVSGIGQGYGYLRMRRF